jgi:hypothetical protein
MVEEPSVLLGVSAVLHAVAFGPILMEERKFLPYDDQMNFVDETGYRNGTAIQQVSARQLVTSARQHASSSNPH